MKEIYAHSIEGKSPEDWQTLREHLTGAATLAEGFVKKFTSEAWAETAVLLHDLGKISGGFQRKLFTANGLEYEDTKESGSVNHSNAGAAYAEEKYGPIFGRTLAYLIMGHHAGLPDYQSDKTGNAALIARMREAKENLEAIRKNIEPYVAGLNALSSFPPWVKSCNYHLWVRMLFSCLVDADWLDTERVMDSEKHARRSQIELPSIDELARKFQEFMDENFSGTGKTCLNTIRNEILDACRAAAQREPGLFTLTVPTGGGKTLSSMAFALEHAKKHGKDRIIYVIPYTSIIEQTAKVFRDAFGDANVVEHHSNISQDDDDGDEDNFEKRKRRLEMDMASENWDARIIVTTNVQFFESLYAAKPRRCRKLHNIVNSVVLIDEAQLISPDYLTPCVDAINELTKSFGVSIVLCTATQPALRGLNAAHEIVPNLQKYYESLKRVEYHFPEDTEKTTQWEELAEQLRQYDEVLCVVNTRRDCRNLYDLMKDLPGTIHLSALMCGRHRSDVIGKIKDRLEKNRELKKAGVPPEPLRVISTQLVEAGVDIDFPVVYRALAGLDSIIQAAGRCNREGELDGLGHVYIFIPPDHAPRGLLRKGEDTTKKLLGFAQPPDVYSVETHKTYFERFYNEVTGQGNDTNGAQYRKLLIDEVCLDEDDEDGVQVGFRTFDKLFKLIEDECTSSVIVRYGKGIELLEKLQKEGPHRDLVRKLQRFTVNIPQYAAEKMCSLGIIRYLEVRGKKTDILIQENTGCYKDEYGFDMSDPCLIV